MGKADWCWVKDHPEGRTAMHIVSTGVDGQWACSQECFSAGHHVDPRDMQRAYPAPSDQKNGAESFVAEVVGRLKAFELTNEQGHALLDAIRRSVRGPEPKFYGPGIASFIVGEQKKLDLKADAKRLAELRDCGTASIRCAT